MLASILASGVSGWWVCGEKSGGRVIGLATRNAQNFQPGVFRFHPQVTDYHLVNARLESSKGFGRAAGSIYLKSMKFENGFQSEQDGEIVIHKKNAAFHARLFVAARSIGSIPPAAICGWNAPRRILRSRDASVAFTRLV
jgi:hypothetical protein